MVPRTGYVGAGDVDFQPPGRPKTARGWEIDPDGLYELLTRLTRTTQPLRYGSPERGRVPRPPRQRRRRSRPGPDRLSRRPLPGRAPGNPGRCRPEGLLYLVSGGQLRVVLRRIVPLRPRTRRLRDPTAYPEDSAPWFAEVIAETASRPPRPRSRVLTGPGSTARTGSSVEAMDHRRDVQDFLASRRARLTPEQAGLASLRRAAAGAGSAAGGGRHARRGQRRLLRPARARQSGRRVGVGAGGGGPGPAARRRRTAAPARPGPQHRADAVPAPQPAEAGGDASAGGAGDPGRHDRRFPPTSATLADGHPRRQRLVPGPVRAAFSTTTGSR